MKQMETAANLFLYIENGLIKSLGAVGHLVDVANDDQIACYLKAHVADDCASAKRYLLPVDSIKAWLRFDATDGLP